MSDEVTIVTGSSSGLGNELVRQLVDNGKLVVGVSRTPWPNGTIDEAQGVQVLGSVSDPETVSGSFAAADELGELTTVISCAGMGVFGDPGSYSRGDIDEVLAGNLIGTILFSDCAFQRFSKRGSGTIVNVMSTAAHAARPKETVYTAAKWGARGYTDALRAAAKGTKVRVLGIYPGGMKTSFWSNARGGEVDSSAFADPAEIAAAIINASALRETCYTTDLLLNRI